MGNRKLKVLQLGKQYFPHIGGIEVTMQQIAEGIQGEVDSFVLAAQGKGAAYTKVINGVPVYYARSLGVVASLPISWDLIRWLCKHASEYDIIHLHMPFPLGDLACLLSGFRGKLVLYWHSDIVRQKKAMYLYKPLMNWTLRRADAIAVATQGNIDGSPYVKPFEDKCVLIPFGLRDEWRKKSDQYWANYTPGPDKDSLRILFIGRLVYYKGCDVLMRAMKQIKDKTQEGLRNIELHLVGTGTLEAELKEYVRQTDMEDYIHFLGRASDAELEREIEWCDVLAFPSVANSEAFGLVQMEVMAYGKPVINTSLPTGVPWVSLDGKTGLTVHPGSPEELADAIMWMKNNPERRQEMGRNARERIMTEFSQKQMLDRLLKLYRGLCEN